MLFYLLFDFSSFINSLFNGYLSLFILGFLFTLGIYHFLLYFQHKDKSYLYYSLYLLVIFIYLLNKTHSFFLTGIIVRYSSFLWFINTALQWTIFIVYALFVQTYIDLKWANPKWNTIVNYALIAHVAALFIILTYSYIFDDFPFMQNVFYYFVAPIALLSGIVLLLVIWHIDTMLKHYIIIGSVFYMLMAFVSLYFIIYNIGGSLFPFYLAVIVENIFFALGLGAKQKKLLLDKNQAQQTVIEEQKLNLTLQKNIQKKLDREVALQTEKIFQLTKKNKKEQQHQLALAYSKQTLELRMRALQTQMNPHFLFNSLNSIKHFIINNNKREATFFLSKLSMFIRKILDNSRLKEITLQEEVTIMQLYLEVENIRLKKDIQFSVNSDDTVNLNAIKIPPLVLQPFIENAIWHGLALRKGLKTIQMNISMVNTILKISILDNGIGRENAAKHKAAKLVEKESLGVDLSKKRLIAYTNHKTTTASVIFKDLYKDNKPTGTEVVIKIPL